MHVQLGVEGAQLSDSVNLARIDCIGPLSAFGAASWWKRPTWALTAECDLSARKW